VFVNHHLNRVAEPLLRPGTVDDSYHGREATANQAINRMTAKAVRLPGAASHIRV
jgi:hypothetical protein